VRVVAARTYDVVQPAATHECRVAIESGGL